MVSGYQGWLISDSRMVQIHYTLHSSLFVNRSGCLELLQTIYKSTARPGRCKPDGRQGCYYYSVHPVKNRIRDIIPAQKPRMRVIDVINNPLAKDSRVTNKEQNYLSERKKVLHQHLTKKHTFILFPVYYLYKDLLICLIVI